jgi:putative tricarboxylic transport membrane protein
VDEEAPRKIDGANPARNLVTGRAIALALAGLAAVLVFDAGRLPSGAVYGVGPQAMPIVVAVGLALLAIGNFIDALRGNLPPRESADRRPVLLILAGLALLIVIIGLGGGFILAASALFVATSAAFGRRAILIDFSIAMVLGALVYLAFDKLLTLSLPAGPLERLL